MMVDKTFFPLARKILVEELCKDFGLEFAGDGHVGISDVAHLTHGQQGSLVFYNSSYLREKNLKMNASACLIKKSEAEKIKNFSGVKIFSEHPYSHFCQIADRLFPSWNDPLPFQSTLIHPDAKIHPSAQLANNVFVGAGAQIGRKVRVGPNVVIGPGTRIGDDCCLHSNVVIQYAHLGDKCTILNGTMIGQAGFGFTIENGVPVDMPQLGRVLIEENVSIGANVAIDRGALSDTKIGAGTRIDNLVQIAHGVIIGRGCIIVSQVGISGSCTIGDYSALGGQVGLSDHVTLGKKVQVAAQSGVMRSCEDNEVLGGTPAVPIQSWRRQCAFLNRAIRKG
jgi:UDP-3-O-[3-hydroxymyristoyl] glucosamine N-acyltransferase